MIRRTDNERLLDEVMAGESDAAFHEALLGEMLRRARRRRRVRHARHSVMVVAGLVGVVVLIWHCLPIRDLTPTMQQVSYTLIRTESLPAIATVTTYPLPVDSLVASVPTANIIETSPKLFREIGDAELLAMVAPKVAALVRLGPHQAELVVLDPASQNGSPPN